MESIYSHPLKFPANTSVYHLGKWTSMSHGPVFSIGFGITFFSIMSILSEKDFSLMFWVYCKIATASLHNKWVLEQRYWQQ